MGNSRKKTVHIFPERCSIGVIEEAVTDSSQKLRFGVVELFVGADDSDQFESIYTLIRRSRFVRLIHLPSLFQEEDPPESSTLIFSFHETRQSNAEFDEPDLAAIVHLDMGEGIEALVGFNEQVIKDGHFGITMKMNDEILILYLIELVAIAEPIRKDGFHPLIANYIGQPRFYAEYMTPLEEPIYQLIHAVGNYRENLAHAIKKDSVDLTGLIPDGLA